jgi:rhodanese-related sulfurtransferase
VIARALRESALLLLLAALPATIMGVWQVKTTKETALEPGKVRAKEAKEWAVDKVWVDARSRTKFERRKVPGAVLLNSEEWDELVPKFLDAWSPDKAVIVYGDREGDAAASIAHRLREELKIGNVWVLHGGFDEWSRR